MAQYSNPRSKAPSTRIVVRALLPEIFEALNAKATEICASGATLILSDHHGSGVTLTISDKLMLGVLERATEAHLAGRQDEINDEVEGILRKSLGTGGASQ